MTSTGLLVGVVDPWSWPRAAGASDRERAIEDIGPFEPLDGARAGSPTVNTNAHYWTNLVGIAWNRDVDIDFDDEPVDLDGDGVPDARVTRHIHAKGGILANPGLFGLVPTPDDPRGRVGRISASTGVLGLREALDDTNASAVADRRARGFPNGRTVRARLLLAGPGRQDLTGEFGLDVTVPGTHAARYPGTRRVRQGTKGIVNPISVPGILATAGVDLQNWSGSEIASARWLRRLVELGGGPATETLRALGLPAADLDDPRSSAAPRRALLLDLRNLGTLGLQQDSFPGLLWADAIYGNTKIQPGELTSIPPMYGIAAVRRVLALERTIPAPLTVDDSTAVAHGRDIFANRIVGVIANRQILKESPRLYAAAQLGGPGHTPILAPIDEALPPTFPVRCADCHNATPGGAPVALHQITPPLGRCGHCHRAHAPIDETPGHTPKGLPDSSGRLSFAALGVPAAPNVEVAFCTRCHERHRPFTPVVYSGSLLLPFDADGDGNAQDDEGDDARAGGIGTEALLAFDVPRPERPPAGFGVDLPSLASLHTLGRISTTRIGVSWVRVPPLLGARATAPYLHNGSVPSLRALLDPARLRPASFRLGAAGFVFDTRLAGNRNIGHEFGTALSPREKTDLVAFLQSL